MLLLYSGYTFCVLLQIVMAETKIEEKVEEAAKIDLFEDDDEFEEFEIGLGIPFSSFSPNFFIS